MLNPKIILLTFFIAASYNININGMETDVRLFGPHISDARKAINVKQTTQDHYICITGELPKDKCDQIGGILICKKFTSGERKDQFECYIEVRDENNQKYTVDLEADPGHMIYSELIKKLNK